MWLRLTFLLVLLASVIGVYLWNTPQALQALNRVKGRVATTITDATPSGPVLYKWKDKSGQVTYGAEPPKGVRAQRMDEASGSMSVVPATKVPVIPKLDDASSDPRSIRERAIERAIDAG